MQAAESCYYGKYAQLITPEVFNQYQDNASVPRQRSEFVATPLKAFGAADACLGFGCTHRACACGMYTKDQMPIGLVLARP